MDSSRMSSEVVANRVPTGSGAVVYPACLWRTLILLAKMDIRAPRANRGCRLQEPGLLSA